MLTYSTVLVYHSFYISVRNEALRHFFSAVKKKDEIKFLKYTSYILYAENAGIFIVLMPDIEYGVTGLHNRTAQLKFRLLW